MLTFEDLRSRLLQELRGRIRNGEITERRLSRITRISQPHIHNVLKGVRALTPEMGDEILRTLHLSLSDLIPTSVPAAREAGESTRSGHHYVDMLKGLIGPNHPWPGEVHPVERYRTSINISDFVNPIAGRMGEDVRMAGLFSENDIAVMDQSFTVRSEVNASGLYLVKSGGSGVIRRARATIHALYLYTEDCVNRPGAWQRIPLSTVTVEQSIRARVYFPPTDDQWDLPAA